MDAKTELSKVMDRVAKLLNMAEDPNCEPNEAQAMRERADGMMLKYTIDEAELDRTKGVSQRQVPELMSFDICPANSPLKMQLTGLVMVVAEHFRVKVVFYNLNPKAVYGIVTAQAVGFPSDLKFFALLFGTLHLHLAGQLEPVVDLEKSFDENVYNLHEAGLKWVRIKDLLNLAYSRGPGAPVDPTWAEVPWPDGKRLIRAYRRHCAVERVEPKAVQSPITYQRNLVEAYAQRIATRLYMMRAKSAQQSAGTALALRTEDVSAKVAELFPELKTLASKAIRTDWNARERGWAAGNAADLSTSDTVRGDRKAALDG